MDQALPQIRKWLVTPILFVLLLHQSPNLARLGLRQRVYGSSIPKPDVTHWMSPKEPRDLERLGQSEPKNNQADQKASLYAQGIWPVSVELMGDEWN